jgi:hypothetical protein
VVFATYLTGDENSSESGGVVCGAKVVEVRNDDEASDGDAVRD